MRKVVIYIVISIITISPYSELWAQHVVQPKPVPGIKVKDPGVKDLPLLEFPVQGDNTYFAVILSGNGGWRMLVSTITQYLLSKNIPVVGMNCAMYFTKYKSHEILAGDLSRLINHYSAKFNRTKVILIGYSMGAEVLPFAINHLPNDDVKMLVDLIMVAPSQKSTFHDHYIDHIYDRRKGDFILPELQKLVFQKGFLICDDGKFALCRKELPAFAETLTLAGGHHFDRKYMTIARIIGKRLGLEK